MGPSHVHADALTIILAGAAYLFWQTFFKNLARWGLAKSPDSATWQGLADITGV